MFLIGKSTVETQRTWFDTERLKTHREIQLARGVLSGSDTEMYISDAVEFADSLENRGDQRAGYAVAAMFGINEHTPDSALMPALDTLLTIETRHADQSLSGKRS